MNIWFHGYTLGQVVKNIVTMAEDIQYIRHS